MLRLEQVAKVYRRRGEAIQAFECGSLTIDRGEYVATIGPSGSGKTTLLSVLGGMLAPTQGTVWVEDRSLYELSVVERARLRSRRIGFVFQSFNLVPYLTALENVQLPLLLAGVSPAAQQERAATLLERFGLASRLHHKPSELSVGQQQRVAIARTLANDPEILLADEPTGNLDPDSRAAVLATLRDCHEEGRTIVMVTHDPVAASHAERILTMRSGVLVDDSSSPRVQLAA